MTEPVLNAPSFEFYEFFPKDFLLAKREKAKKDMKNSQNS